MIVSDTFVNSNLTWMYIIQTVIFACTYINLVLQGHKFYQSGTILKTKTMSCIQFIALVGYYV